MFLHTTFLSLQLFSNTTANHLKYRSYLLLISNYHYCCCCYYPPWKNVLFACFSLIYFLLILLGFDWHFAKHASGQTFLTTPRNSIPLFLVSEKANSYCQIWTWVSPGMDWVRLCFKCYFSQMLYEELYLVIPFSIWFCQIMVLPDSFTKLKTRLGHPKIIQMTINMSGFLDTVTSLIDACICDFSCLNNRIGLVLVNPTKYLKAAMMTSWGNIVSNGGCNKCMLRQCRGIIAHSLFYPEGCRKWDFAYKELFLCFLYHPKH